MSGDGSNKPRMSLYANLLKKDGPDAPGTISSGPVVYKQGENQKSDDIIANAKAKLNAAALRFQPTKRPQVTTQKSKVPASKPLLPPAPRIPQSQDPKLGTPKEAANIAGRQPPKTTIEDWTAEPDEDVYYQAEKRQRGGRKKRKKNKEFEPQPVNWDDIYDPSRPNNYEEYKNSDEKLREIREWKDRLYAHRNARRHSSDTDSSDDDRRPQIRNQFAPPGMSFAPPSNLAVSNTKTSPPPPPPPMETPDDQTGDDAYTRRLQMSQEKGEAANPSQNPQPGYQSEIVAAPVRYNLPPPPPELPTSEAELEQALQNETQDESTVSSQEPHSVRPGQKGFAERLMNKYGWTKGSGLGAQGTGITTALSVKVDKQKRKPDCEGGGFAGPGGRGKIIGGRRPEGTTEEGKFGAMSEVVILRGMVDGLDLRRELGEGSLVQEIGEECGEKYGRVERVFIDQHAQDGAAPVFVKFTSQLSALRAVNALEGRIFNGNAISARFYDKDKFDSGDYSV